MAIPKSVLNLLILLSMTGKLLSAQISDLDTIEELDDENEFIPQPIKSETIQSDESFGEDIIPEAESSEANATRINGGQLVTKVVPYQVSLQIYRRGRWHHFCGGSIITPNHVLTAAHCVDRLAISDFSVVAGTLSWKLGGDRHQVAAKRLHPKFAMDPLIINDIALLKVTPAFNLHKSTIATISLGSPSRVGEKVAVLLTGWGSVTETPSAGLPEQLQGLHYRTISNEECARKGFRVTGNELCALAAKGRGACVGDSGGPLVTLQNVPQIVGIVSYGTARCAQGRPDVYTRVSSFLPYINRVISNEIP